MLENGPLQGIRVLDLTRMLPGPFCTLLLADWGADVVMIEQPSEAAIGPKRKDFFIDRNKRSLSLNLKDLRGRDLFHRLAASADVVVEGFRPGVPARLGVNYNALRKINPGLVYCSISGFGQDGPYRMRVGHDINYIAIGGLLSLTGRKDEDPVIPGTQVADIGGGGFMAAGSILAALFYRERTGQGQYIDVSMTDGALAFNAIAWHEYFSKGTPPSRGGHRLLGSVPCYNVYRTADDRHITIGALEPKFWAVLCRKLGREDLIDLQFDDSGDTMAEMQRIFRSKRLEEWDALLAEEDVCYAPVLDLCETAQNEQVLYREMVVPVETPGHAVSAQVGITPKFSLSPGRIRLGPPQPGRDAYSVLTELGLEPAEITALETEGVLGPTG